MLFLSLLLRQSDDLINAVSIAGTDANNAVALTLAALQSVFAAQTSALKLEQALAQEYFQTKNLLQTLTGLQADQIRKKGLVSAKKNQSLYSLLKKAYEMAKDDYEITRAALNTVTMQLNNAQTILTQSEFKLKSLQSGLMAA